jgi:bacillithiol biosynthesis deacetylase BshB1
MSVDILAFGAHPDDIEFGCGAILAQCAARGSKIAMVDLTLGDKGSQGTPEERRQEALRSAQLIGAERLFLNFRDCQVIDTYEGRLELVRMIRHFKPKLVLAPIWQGEVNHPDHFACGTMARYACRYARFKQILPELPIHTPQGILHYAHPIQKNPDFLIDVCDAVERWKEMILCHASQLKNRPYLQRCLTAAAHWGSLIGVEYAQPLVKGNPIVIKDPLSIAQGTIEI